MRTTIALLAAVLLLTASLARGQVPLFISYQGLLQDAAGNPVADGVYPLTFRLFNEPDGGEPLWEERHDDVKVTNGVFNVLLGSLTRLEPSLFESETWITVTFREERMPRFRIGAVPYSVQALSSQFASKTGDLFGPDGRIRIGDCEPGGTGACLKWDKEAGLNIMCPAGSESCLDVDGSVIFGPVLGPVTFMDQIFAGAIGTHQLTIIGAPGDEPVIRFEARQDGATVDIEGSLQADKVQALEFVAAGEVGHFLGLSYRFDNDVSIDGTLQASAFGIEGDDYRFEGASYRFNAPVVFFRDVESRTIRAFNVQADGTLQADRVQAKVVEAEVKNFRIDHPLDPAGKYLYHTSVESPDMLNLYNGTVTLDASGQALVQLPAYFEALNRDFRYQLTCIGGFAPVYVAEEISGNRFKIAGGVPGLKVSWQVTGVRKDPYAEAHRSPVEADKPAGERGTYLHPELYGQPSARR